MRRKRRKNFIAELTRIQVSKTRKKTFVASISNRGYTKLFQAFFFSIYMRLFRVLSMNSGFFIEGMC